MAQHLWCCWSRITLTQGRSEWMIQFFCKLSWLLSSDHFSILCIALILPLSPLLWKSSLGSAATLEFPSWDSIWRGVLSASITLVLVRLHSRVKVSLRVQLGCTEAGWFLPEIALQHNASVANGEYENGQHQSGECILEALWGSQRLYARWSCGTWQTWHPSRLFAGTLKERVNKTQRS